MSTDMAAPQVAIVGHTNTGKTSLLRTLARDARFGEVEDRPATTRDVRGIDLLDEDHVAMRLFDTPGLEDALALAEQLKADMAAGDDPVARISAFVAGDHGNGRFEQEARVLRQVLESDAALYVVDAREPVLAKHRAELRLLADCGRPILPVLNFVASPEADDQEWRKQLAHSGLHLVTAFDTVVFDLAAEAHVFEALGTVLEAHRARLQGLVRQRQEQRRAQRRAATRAIARLLVDAAGMRYTVPRGMAESEAKESLRSALRRAEQDCIALLLDLFAFELGAYRPPELPLQEGRWQLDLFDPEAARALGIRGGSAAAAGGAAGFGVDALSGGLSLGAGMLIGAAVGAVVGVGDEIGRVALDRVRGRRTLAVESTTLQILAARQLALLAALLRRGHASQETIAGPVQATLTDNTLLRLLRRARAHPEWARGQGPARDEAGAERACRQLADALEQALLAASDASNRRHALSVDHGSVQ